jgi:hypothetical protein
VRSIEESGGHRGVTENEGPFAKWELVRMGRFCGQGLSSTDFSIPPCKFLSSHSIELFSSRNDLFQLYADWSTTNPHAQQDVGNFSKEDD